MDLSNDLLLGLNDLIDISPETMTFLSSSVPVSASVYKSYNQYDNREMRDTHYGLQFDNAFVLTKASDVKNWGLIPQSSSVTIGGEQFQIGQNIVKTPVYWQIYLRLIQ